jgi:hypothetical protein
MRSFWVEKILPRFFCLREIHKKPKKLIFLDPTSTNAVYGRNFTYAWLQLILYNNSPQFRSNRRQNFFLKKPWTPTFYQNCTRKKHLNGRSSLIKHNMTMNYTPLDSSFQCASFESKKFYLAFLVWEKFTKNQKNSYFWIPHQQMRSMAGTLPTPDFNSSYTITHRNFVRISDKKFFRKNHEPLPSIKIAPGKNI